MTYMLPKFMTLFGNMNVQLPMMTQILIEHQQCVYRLLVAMLLVLGLAYIVLSQDSRARRRASASWTNGK